jgi:ribosomal protein S18 acetylase RimI-like enzyme
MIKYFLYEPPNNTNISTIITRILFNVAIKLGQKSFNYIAYNDEIPIGLASFYFNKFPEKSYWTLLAVDKKYKNKFVGINLTRKVLEFCKKNNSKGLKGEVRLSDVDLVNFYKSFGFSIGDYFFQDIGNVEKAMINIEFR